MITRPFPSMIWLCAAPVESKCARRKSIDEVAQLPDRLRTKPPCAVPKNSAASGSPIAPRAGLYVMSQAWRSRGISSPETLSLGIVGPAKAPPPLHVASIDQHCALCVRTASNGGNPSSVWRPCRSAQSMNFFVRIPSRAWCTPSKHSPFGPSQEVPGETANFHVMTREGGGRTHFALLSVA
jgi:hypothetical protein